MALQVLILAPLRSLRGIRAYQAGRLLLAGLEEQGIQITLHRPWKPVPGLARFDAVVCWTYHHTWHNHLAHCRKIEVLCKAIGIPLLNSPRKFNYLHSRDLAVWSGHDLPCARHQCFSDLEQIELDYPMILRRDGQHLGRDMFLVETPEQARDLLVRRAAEPESRPLNLAVEFVDTRWPDGLYRKRRCYVVGDEVIPAHAMPSEGWLVNYGTVAGNMGSYLEHRAFLREGEPQAELIRRAAAVLGADWAAVDYSPTPDGGCVLWEANRNPRMWGDQEYPTSRPQRGDRRYGQAVAELIRRRAEGRPRI